MKKVILRAVKEFHSGKLSKDKEADQGMASSTARVNFQELLMINLLQEK